MNEGLADVRPIGDLLQRDRSGRDRSKSSSAARSKAACTASRPRGRGFSPGALFTSRPFNTPQVVPLVFIQAPTRSGALGDGLARARARESNNDGAERLGAATWSRPAPPPLPEGGGGHSFRQIRIACRRGDWEASVVSYIPTRQHYGRQRRGGAVAGSSTSLSLGFCCSSLDCGLSLRVTTPGGVRVARLTTR